MSTYVHKPLPKHYSTSRALRNEAERQRRDKLNHYVSELAALVPFVSKAKKRVDKTSILRLAASYIRLHKVLNKSDKKFENLALSVNSGPAFRELFNSIGGFLLVITTSGKIVYVSEAIEDSFGYSQNDVLGQCFYSLIHHEDAKILRQQLQPKDSPRRSFYCRLLEKNISRNDKSRYQIIHVMGHMKDYSPESELDEQSSTKDASESSALSTRRRDRRKSSSEKSYDGSSRTVNSESEESMNEDDDKMSSTESTASSQADGQILVAFVKVVRDRLVTELTWVESMRDEYITRHRLDGSIVYADHRISFVAGLMPEEVFGKSAFDYMHPNDICWSLLAQKQMLGNGQGQGIVTYRLECKDGSYVILRSRGFMEVNKETGKVDTFICINTVLSVKAAEDEVTSQRKSLLPILKSEKNDNAMEAMASGLPPEIKNLLKKKSNVLQNFFNHVARILTESPEENVDSSKLMFEAESKGPTITEISDVTTASENVLKSTCSGARSKRRSCNEVDASMKLRRRLSNSSLGNNVVKYISHPQANQNTENVCPQLPDSRIPQDPQKSLFSNGHSESLQVSRNPWISVGQPTCNSWMASGQPLPTSGNSWSSENISQVSPPWVNHPTPAPEAYLSTNIQPSYSQIENWGYPNCSSSYPSSVSNPNDSQSWFPPYDRPPLSFDDKASTRGQVAPGDFCSGITDMQTLVSHSSDVSFQRK